MGGLFMKEVYVAEICRKALLPQYQNDGRYTFAAEDVIIKPNETVIVPTGLKFAPMFEIQY